jgi:hypothetical protein
MIKSLFVLTALLTMSLQSFSQMTDTLFRYYGKKIEKFDNTSGEGNSTFSKTLTCFEKLIKGNLTKTKFEAFLPSWQIVETGVSLGYNEETEEHDLPEYSITYLLVMNGYMVYVEIEMEKSPEAILNSINVSGLNSYEYDKLKDSLQRTGYLYRSNFKYYVNESKKIYIKPYECEQMDYCVKIF